MHQDGSLARTLHAIRWKEHLLDSFSLPIWSWWKTTASFFAWYSTDNCPLTYRFMLDKDEINFSALFFFFFWERWSYINIYFCKVCIGLISLYQLYSTAQKHVLNLGCLWCFHCRLGLKGLPLCWITTLFSIMVLKHTDTSHVTAYSRFPTHLNHVFSVLNDFGTNEDCFREIVS